VSPQPTPEEIAAREAREKQAIALEQQKEAAEQAKMPTTERVISSIEFRNGIYFAPNETEPFTGKCITYFTAKITGLSGYKNGKLDGLTALYNEKGEKIMEENFKDGMRIMN
jgi:antitoxin component YwqK of YwqJK toxin-antitoxin module